MAEILFQQSALDPGLRIEALRHALHGQIVLLSLAVVVSALVIYLIAAAGYDPQRGLVKSGRG